MPYIFAAQLHDPRTGISEIIPVQEMVKTDERLNEIESNLIKKHEGLEVYWVSGREPDIPISLSSSLSD